MAEGGFVLDLIGIIVATLATYYFGTCIFDITDGNDPEWDSPTRNVSG